jgi:outer membrane protein assembly factor BamB
LNLDTTQSNPAGIRTRHGGRGPIWALLLLASLGLLLSGCTGRRIASTSWPGITVDGELAYVAFNQQIFAVDPGQQRTAGEFPASPGSTTFYAAPAVTDGLLVTGGYDSVLYGVDRATLRVVWNFHLASDRYIASPVILTGTVFAATGGNELFALDLATLEGLGTMDKPDDARRSAEQAAVKWTFEAGQGIWAAPLVTPSTIYMTSLDHHVYAVETETGRELWTIELDGAMAGTPVLSPDEETLFVGNFDYDLYALDAATGNIRWRIGAANWVWGRPVLAAEKLFFGDLAGYLYAVNPGTGELLWSEKVADAIRGAPVYDPESGRLYIAGRRVSNPGAASTYGIVLAIDASSYQTLWEQATEEAVYTGPALSNGLLLVTPSQGDTLMIVYNAETGVLQWRFVPAGES